MKMGLFFKKLAILMSISLEKSNGHDDGYIYIYTYIYIYIHIYIICIYIYTYIYI